MNNIRKVILSILACLLVVVNAVPVLAEPDQESSAWTATAKADSNLEALKNVYDKQFGVLYNLYYLSSAIRWTEFIGRHDFFSVYEQQAYFDRLKSSVEDLNRRFEFPEDVDQTSLDYIQIPVPTNLTNIHNFSSRTINGAIPEYLEKILISMKDKTEVSEDDKIILRYLYRILVVLVSDQNDMTVLTQDGTHGVTISSKAEAILQNSEYIALLDKARELVADDLSTTNSTELGDFSKSYIERMAWVSYKTLAESKPQDLGADNWKPLDNYVDDKGGFMLRDVYMRIFSASSVYTPGVSSVGSEEFLEALGNLFPDDQKDEALKLYDEMKNYRKPLYSVYSSESWFKRTFRDDNTDLLTQGSYKGKASPATVEELMKAIEDEKPIALLPMKGKLATSSDDMNTFVYYSDNAASGIPTKPSSEAPVIDVPVWDTDSEETTEAPTTTGNAVQDSVQYVNKVLASAANGELTSQYWAAPVFQSSGKVVGNFQFRETNLSLMVMYNYYKDLDFMDSSDKKRSYLFINAFGDIVTADNLVIVPASANPAYYTNGEGYNPYTVMFMKGYPGMYYRGGEIVGTESDKGKWILVRKEGEDSEQVFVKIKGDNDFRSTDPRYSYKIDLEMSSKVPGATNLFELEDPTEKLVLRFLSSDHMVDMGVVSSKDLYKDAKMVLKKGYSLNGVSLVSYDPGSDEDFQVAQYIAENMLASLKMVNQQLTDTFNKKVRQDLLFRSALVESMNGVVQAKSYETVLKQNEDEFEDIQLNAWKRWWADSANLFLSTIGNVPGALGIADIISDKYFGEVYEMLDSLLLYLIIVCIVVYIIRIMRSRFNIVYSFFFLALSVFVIFVFVRLSPIYSTKAVNVIVDSTAKRLSFDILLTKSEDYRTTYGKSGGMDSDGRFIHSTTTLDLVHLTDKELNEILSSQNISKKDITGGNVYVLDPENGVFLEGDTIKINTDLLWLHNPITGSYDPTDSTSSYVLETEKVYSSVVDYYTPYYQIQQGFVDSLNRLLEVYKIPKYSIPYSDGLTKDGYIIQSFLVSAPFLTPNNYREGDTPTDNMEMQTLYNTFDNEETLTNSYDYLNIVQMMLNPSPEMKETLWWKTALDNGYLPVENDGGEGARNLDTLARIVNENTKDFLMGYKDRIGSVSDENLIKVSSLYATTVFNKVVSKPYHQVYPKNINFSEFKLTDVYTALFMKDFTTYRIEKGDISQYVVRGLDPMTTFFYAIMTLLSSLFVRVTNQMFPALILLFGVILLVQIFLQGKVKPVTVGFAKIAGLFFVCVTTHSVVLTTTRTWNTTLQVYTYLILYILVLNLITIIIYSLVTNLGEFGNTKLNATFKNIADRLQLTRMLRATTTSITQQNSPTTSSDPQAQRYQMNRNYTAGRYQTASRIASRHYPNSVPPPPSARPNASGVAKFSSPPIDLSSLGNNQDDKKGPGTSSGVNRLSRTNNSN